MRTKDKHKIKEIRAIINCVYDRPQVDEEEDEKDLAINRVLVQTLRNEETYLKYDVSPIFFGIAEKSLSFYYKTLNWANRTENFEYTNPHVLCYPQYYRLLERVHENVQKTKSKIVFKFSALI